MTEHLTPDFWVNLSATIFFAATVGLMLWDTRTQKKGLHQEAYQAVRADHTELIRMILDKPFLNQVYDTVQRPSDKKAWEDFTPDEKTIGHYYGLHFDLYERLFALYNKNEMEKEEWKQWILWLKQMSGHWLFEEMFSEIANVLDKKFVEIVKKEILGTPEQQSV